MQAAWGRFCHKPFQVCSITLIIFCPFARISSLILKQLEFLRKIFDSRPNFDPRMALKGHTGDFAGESPEAQNAHLTSLPNAKKDMFNVGRRQCLEKRNTGTAAQTHVCVCDCMCTIVCLKVFELCCMFRRGLTCIVRAMCVSAHAYTVAHVYVCVRACAWEWCFNLCVRVHGI